MVIEANKALVRRFVEEVINWSRPEALDELLSEGYAYHAPGMEIAGSQGIGGRWCSMRREPAESDPGWNFARR